MSGMPSPNVIRMHLVVCLSFFAQPLTGSAQNLAPNGGFETGTNAPAGWRIEGHGAWTETAHHGRHGISVEGDGNSSSMWQSKNIPLGPDSLYRIAVSARSDASGGSGIAGAGRVHRDFRATSQWQEQRFVFSTPTDSASEAVRLGEWHVKGGLVFDDAELLPVLAAHVRLPGGAELGEAESIRGGTYRFNPHFGWPGANYHRPLRVNHAAFNSDRWMFSPGAELIYRVGVRGVAQQSATLRVNMNYYIAGTLLVEASPDARAWQPIGRLEGAQRSATWSLPTRLFPADELFVRLRASGGNANFQVNAFDYQAPLSEPSPDVEGQTHFLARQEGNPKLAVQFRGARLTNASRWAIDLVLSNRTAQPLSVKGVAALQREAARDRQLVQLPAHGAAPMSIAANATAPGAQTMRVQLTEAAGEVLFAAETDLQLHFLLDPRPGHWLAASDTLGAWWCEAGWKIGRDRAMPPRPENRRTEPVAVSAARGEYEPAQVVLRPGRDGELRAVEISRLHDAAGNPAEIKVELNEVGYVHVTQPTDGSCQRGWHPDPLPALRTPLKLRGGQNQPLWLTFHVSRDARPGNYGGELLLKTTLGDIRVPLAVQVYGFALPKETHLRSAFGLGTRDLNRYHQLTSAADREAVFDMYLQNFAEHRISPYSFFDYAPIEVRFHGAGTNKQAEVDFTKFDRAASRWLDDEGFSTFRLPLQGMGGGTFHSRHLGRLEGFEEGTPEHARLFADYLGQVERHLRERGWLGKAFTYWFDEPDPKDYEFVVAGNERIRAAAPGLARMLTEQPEPALLGHVEIWCGLTPEWTPEKVRARRAAGEHVWWYICTGPKAPYVTEFIDHPGSELRLWPWQSWQYGVEGILVWASTYWNSGAAFPAPRQQDPWTDPMSYVSGYDFQPGHVGFWGNGDGRFLYPPRRSSDTGGGPLVDGPVNSVRWENLRDGMEDYEYFWMLQREVQRLRESKAAHELAREAESLLSVPKEISADLTHFTTDPRPMLAHRDRMARMIERLQSLP